MKKTLATLSLFALLPLAGMPSVAAAEVNCEEPREASGSLSEFTYRRLTRIQADIAEEKYSDAIEGARKLLPTVQRNDYDKAFV